MAKIMDDFTPKYLRVLTDREFLRVYLEEVAGKLIAGTTPRMALVVQELDRRAQAAGWNSY